MQEAQQDIQELRTNETDKEGQLAIESSSDQVNVSEMLETLKSVKNEEQELLSQRKKLQATQSELLNEVVTQIDTKKKAIAALKSEVVFLQNKCNELERALGIPVY